MGVAKIVSVDLNIPSEVKFTERGVLLENHFIVSDLHIGYSDVIESMTIEDERAEILDRLEKVYKDEQVDRLVVAGDVFHEFGSPSRPARQLLKDIQQSASKHRVEFTAIRGNHDTKAVSDSKYLIDYKDEYYFSATYNGEANKVGVIHGHELPDEDADIYILGHLHPNVKIDGINWPTYLYGHSLYNDSDLFVLPAFSSYKDGNIISKVTRTEIEFPLVSSQDFREFAPIVYDSEGNTTRMFPKLDKSAEYFSI